MLLILLPVATNVTMLWFRHGFFSQNLTSIVSEVQLNCSTNLFSFNFLPDSRDQVINLTSSDLIFQLKYTIYGSYCVEILVGAK